MKDYNIRQMQKLALKYFPYGEILPRLAQATGKLIFDQRKLKFVDCLIIFLVFTEREGVILSIEEAKAHTIYHRGMNAPILLGMLSQLFAIKESLELESEKLRGPCQRYFDALFAMAAKSKVKMIEITDEKLSIYDSIK